MCVILAPAGTGAFPFAIKSQLSSPLRMYTLSAMVHIEFVVLLLALAWLMWMVFCYRYSDLGRLEREVDDIKENQVYALEVLRIALTEIIGVDKTDAVIESAGRNFAEWKK